MSKLFTLFLIILINPYNLLAQADTIQPPIDSTSRTVIDSITDSTSNYVLIRPLDSADTTLAGSLDTSGITIKKQQYDSLRVSKPVPLQTRNAGDKNIIFYLLAVLLLMLGIIRTTYSRYFANMFRVFFNSSLRQSQLTDQLLQDKLPSLFFNALFIFSAGFYFYLIMQREGIIAKDLNLLFLVSSMGVIVLIYLVKFFTLKFIGWITGYHNEADTYIFIIFLINKIIGICLLPVIIILAFADKSLVNIFVIASFIIIALMLLMRFLRSYGLLQHRIRVSRFHFLLYIFSLEILPLLLIYKAISLFVSKYL